MPNVVTPDRVVASTRPDGRGFLVGAVTSGGADILHAPVPNKNVYDELTIEAYNIHGTNIRDLYILLGGSTTEDIVGPVSILPTHPPIPVIIDRPLERGLVVKVYASVTNQIIVWLRAKPLTRVTV